MSLTLITNPVGPVAVKLFAGFKPIEFIFKREDLAITSVTSGTGGAKINHAGDLTSYLSVGDTVYFYSEGTGYTYDTTAEILEIVAGEITVDAPYIVSGTGGYINYFKNYYVELQCVNPTLSDVNLLPFSLQSDGDAAGNITIDVSVVNDLNIQRGATISKQHITESRKEFEVQYRQVYTGSAESFTLIDNKLIVALYAKEDPGENEILNSFDIPKIFLGYPASLVSAITAGADSSTIELTYKELDANQVQITTGTLGENPKDVNGFLMWLWAANTAVNEQTKYIDFDFAVEAFYDFAETDFAYPDFLTQ